MKRLFNFIRKAWAFQKRNILENSSYTFSYALDLFQMLCQAALFFFIARLVDSAENPLLHPYGGDYFSFVLIGIAFAGLQDGALHSFSVGLAEEQSSGTLEAILMTPTSLTTVVFAGALWNFIFVMLNSAFYLLAGKFIFHAQYSFSPLSVFVLILTASSMAGLGIFSAGFLLIHKRGDPVSYFFMSASKFLAGVYFPIAVMPGWIQGFSRFFPLTYALDALRKSMLAGCGLNDVARECGMLLLFTAIFMPAGILYFRYALRKAKEAGSLSFV